MLIFIFRGPTLNVKYVLDLLETMLREPSASSPLEAEIGALLVSNKEEFNKNAREWTKKYAS